MTDRAPSPRHPRDAEENRAGCADLAGISRIELLQRALARVRELDANHAVIWPIELNPPLDEARVRELEARSGITLPDEYRLFLSRIGDGGVFRNTRYLTLDEVLKFNSAPPWSLPLPAELRDLAGKDYLQVAGDSCDDDWPGLLRVTHFTYNQQAIFLTHGGGEYMLWMSSGEELPVCVQETEASWLQGLLDSVTKDLEPLEIMLARMEGSEPFETLEYSPEYDPGHRKTHLLLGTLLGAGTTVSPEALASFRASHAKA